MQVTGEGGSIVFVDDRRDADMAAALLVFFLQINLCSVPQPHQLVVSFRVTTQRHSLIQHHLHDTITGAWSGLNGDALWGKRGRTLKLQALTKGSSEKKKLYRRKQ